MRAYAASYRNDKLSEEQREIMSMSLFSSRSRILISLHACILVKKYKSHRRAPDQVQLPQGLSSIECCLCIECNPERLHQPVIPEDQARSYASLSSSSSSASPVAPNDSFTRRTSARFHQPSEAMLHAIVTEADSNMCLGKESSSPPSSAFTRAQLSPVSLPSTTPKTTYPLLYVDDDDDEEEEDEDNIDDPDIHELDDE